MNNLELTVGQVAAFAQCHRNTVLRYESKGIISSLRDNNGFRRFPVREARKLKGVLSIRVASSGSEVTEQREGNEDHRNQ